MNRLMTFPLAIMVLLMMVTILYVPSETMDGFFSPQSGGTINTTDGNTTVEIPNSVPIEIQLMTMGGIIALVAAASTLAFVAGIRALGSGLSDTSQIILYKSIIYLGVWGVLSGVSIIAGVTENIIGLFFMLGITIMYMIGFAQEIGGTATDG